MKEGGKWRDMERERSCENDRCRWGKNRINKGGEGLKKIFREAASARGRQ